MLLPVAAELLNVTNVTISEMLALGFVEDLWPSFESLRS